MPIDSDPALNVFVGFALLAEKLAPDPTATPAATSNVASAVRERLGRLAMNEKRVNFDLLVDYSAGKLTRSLAFTFTELPSRQSPFSSD
jgi:hypothetical protein